jgi:hypothetical protein
MSIEIIYYCDRCGKRVEEATNGKTHFGVPLIDVSYYNSSFGTLHRGLCGSCAEIYSNMSYEFMHGANFVKHVSVFPNPTLMGSKEK